jgi:hypothetical protein
MRLTDRQDHQGCHKKAPASFLPLSGWISFMVCWASSVQQVYTCSLWIKDFWVQGSGAVCLHSWRTLGPLASHPTCQAKVSSEFCVLIQNFLRHLAPLLPLARCLISASSHKTQRCYHLGHFRSYLYPDHWPKPSAHMVLLNCGAAIWHQYIGTS